MFICIFALYIIVSYLFHIAFLIAPNSQIKEDYINSIEKILGVKRDADIFVSLFPGKFDFSFCFIMAFFANYISKKDRSSVNGGDGH